MVEDARSQPCQYRLMFLIASDTVRLLAILFVTDREDLSTFQALRPQVKYRPSRSLTIQRPR